MKSYVRVLVLAAAVSVSSPVVAQNLDKQWADCESDNGSVSSDDSIAACTAIIESGKETPANLAMAYYDRGTEYAASKNDVRAIADYDRAIAINPTASAYFNRGNSYHRTGNDEHSIADYDSAIQLDPKYVKAYTNRGNRYFTKGDYQAAIAVFQAALTVDPQHATALYGRGLSLEKLGRTTEGEADIAKAKEIDPHIAD